MLNASVPLVFLIQFRNGDPAGISTGVIEADFNRGPIRAECEMLGPLDNHDGFFGQGVLQAKGFEVMKAFYAVKSEMEIRRESPPA